MAKADFRLQKIVKTVRFLIDQVKLVTYRCPVQPGRGAGNQSETVRLKVHFDLLKSGANWTSA
jgi:hypothetical protein